MWLTLPHPLLKHSMLLATVISSRMGKLVPSRNVVPSCWEGNGLILTVKSELSLFFLMESLSKDGGNAWKEAELTIKPKQSCRVLFGLLDLVAHEASFTGRLYQL